MTPRAAAPLVALAAAVSLAACRIEKTPAVDPSQSATSVFVNDASFNPDAMVAEDWDSRVVPTLRDRAGAYDDVAAAIAADPAAAGGRFGFHAAEPGAPWLYAAALSGTITAANTESRAATLTVKTDGGRAVTVQIGPVVRGTAIRDSLAFRPFSAFKNQVDYAQFGKALNTRANVGALAKLPRDALVGRRVVALGVVVGVGGDAAPLLTPVEIRLEPKA